MAKEKTNSEIMDSVADAWVELFTASIKAPMTLVSSQVELGRTMLETWTKASERVAKSYSLSVEKLTDAMESEKDAAQASSKETDKEATGAAEKAAAVAEKAAAAAEKAAAAAEKAAARK